VSVLALLGIAFALYASAWVGAYMGLKGHVGGIAGLFIGTAVMGLLFALAFDERGAAVPSIASLFLLNLAGYYLGNAVELAFLKTSFALAMLLYGVCYGIGFGAGLGLALHFCQKTVRSRLG